MIVGVNNSDVFVFSTSAILYLNDDFEGGKFFFAHSTADLTPQVCSSILALGNDV